MALAHRTLTIFITNIQSILATQFIHISYQKRYYEIALTLNLQNQKKKKFYIGCVGYDLYRRNTQLSLFKCNGFLAY